MGHGCEKSAFMGVTVQRRPNVVDATIASTIFQCAKQTSKENFLTATNPESQCEKCVIMLRRDKSLNFVVKVV